jgi:sorbitol/mannitol transport system permease protein
MLAKRRRTSAIRSAEQAGPVRAITAWVVGVLVFFPVLYLFVTGFKSENDALKLPPTILPVPQGATGVPASFSPTLDNFAAVIDRNFGPFFQHSLIVVSVSVLLVLIFALPAAYALSWRNATHKRDVLFFFISRDLRMIDNMGTLVIMYTAMNLPIAIWMLRSFFDEVPRDVLDASRLDGASIPQELFQVALPMITPGLVATAFICIIFGWNEFFIAVNLSATQAATVPMFMISFVTSEGLFWAKLAAAGTMAMLPVVIIGWSAQRALVRGMSMGAVK